MTSALCRFEAVWVPGCDPTPTRFGLSGASSDDGFQVELAGAAVGVQQAFLGDDGKSLLAKQV